MVTSDKMKLATKILGRVNKLSGKSELWLEAYANGREQGYAIHAMKPGNSRRVAFSEYRRSDQIVIYWGLYSDFSMQGNAPSDEVYFNQAKYFDPGEIEQAAQWIADYLTKDNGA